MTIDNVVIENTFIIELQELFDTGRLKHYDGIKLKDLDIMKLSDLDRTIRGKND